MKFFNRYIDLKFFFDKFIDKLQHMKEFFYVVEN